MDWRAFASVPAREFVEVQLHQVINQVAHLLLVCFQLLAVDDVLVLEVLQEVLQVLDGLVALLALTHRVVVLLDVFAEEVDDLIFGIVLLCLLRLLGLLGELLLELFLLADELVVKLYLLAELP